MDRNGNQWAWWGDPDADGPGVVTGSHLDSVPDGGAFDGPLGVVSRVRRASTRCGRAASTPSHAARRRRLRRRGGRPLRRGLRRARGWRPARSRPDRALGCATATAPRWPTRCAAPGARTTARSGSAPTRGDWRGSAPSSSCTSSRDALDLRRRPVGLAGGVASAIWPHGRWRARPPRARPTTPGRPAVDRAATRCSTSPTCHVHAAPPPSGTALSPRSARSPSTRTGSTPSRRGSRPGSTPAATDRAGGPRECVARRWPGSTCRPESWTPADALRRGTERSVAAVVGGLAGSGSPDGAAAPVIRTGAGHDAGILAGAGVPTAMLFVRNPTGVSHSPDEHAEPADCRGRCRGPGRRAGRPGCCAAR